MNTSSSSGPSGIASRPVEEELAALRAFISRGHLAIAEAESILGKNPGGRPTHWVLTRFPWVTLILVLFLGAVTCEVSPHLFGPFPSIRSLRRELLGVQARIALKKTLLREDQLEQEHLADIWRAQSFRDDHPRLAKLKQPPIGARLRQLGFDPSQWPDLKRGDHHTRLAALEWTSIGVTACEWAELEPAVDAFLHLQALERFQRTGQAALVPTQTTSHLIDLARRGALKVLTLCELRGISLAEAIAE